MTAAATQARQDTATFHHQATIALTERGWKVDGIADLLGISGRSVRRLQDTPCEAYEREREAVRKRQRWEHHMRTKRGRMPFDREAFIEAYVDLDEAEAVWLDDDWPALDTREKVRRYLVDGKVSQAWIARHLGLSRQAVSQHVKALREGRSQ